MKLEVTNELNVGRHKHQLLFLFFQFLFLDFFNYFCFLSSFLCNSVILDQLDSALE